MKFYLRRTIFLLFSANCNPDTHPAITESPSDMTSDRTKTSPDKTGVDRIQGSDGIINADNTSSRLHVMPWAILLSLVTIFWMAR